MGEKRDIDREISDVIALGRKAILTVTVASIAAIALVLGILFLVALQLTQC